MNKVMLYSVLLLSLTANAVAKDEAAPAVKGLKQAGDNAGNLLGQAGKAVAPGVGKVESSLTGVKRSGKKSGKADK